MQPRSVIWAFAEGAAQSNTRPAAVLVDEMSTVSMARRKVTPRMASMNPLCAFLRNLNGKTLSPLKGSLKAVGMMESTGRWMPFPNKTAAWRLDLCPTAR